MSDITEPNFVQLLDELCCDEMGFVISIWDHERIYQNPTYVEQMSIYQWESQFLKKKIVHPVYELQDLVS
jgi:hypothetical protein